MSSIFKWLREHKEFAEQYARAKEQVLEHYADELVEIADDESSDVSGELQMPNSVAVQRARLRVDTRKWILSKLAAKKYGDKLDMNLAGKDGGPIQAAIAVTFVRTNGAPDGSD
jgi:cytochrome c-type biogenesis protein CcmH/NrfG